MTDYVIRGAVRDDIETLANTLRDLDRQEIWASSHRSPQQALSLSLDKSRECFTALADGVPFCMFGVADASLVSNRGMAWLLTSQDIVAHRKQLIKYSEPVARFWADEMYEEIFNFIDARHRPALRWAKHIGFEVAEAKPHGLDRLPFHRISMRRQHV